MRLRNVYHLLTLMLAHASANGGNFENLEGINSQALSFLNAEYSIALDEPEQSSREINIDVKPLDNRLKLLQCDRPLTFELRDSGQRGGRVSVKARCQGSVSWTIYVQATVAIEEFIMVAAENLVRGTIIEPRHLTKVSVDTSRLTPGFAIDSDSLVGKEASRNIQRGKPIRYSYIEEPIAIKRGDLIILEAAGSGISVATEAIAMQSGSMGDRIQVKNQSSKQIVSGQIVGTGRVRAGRTRASRFGNSSQGNDSLAGVGH
ncbi:hypothetical protein NBRC116494_26390 [Aurantivibrio plasticivorans]